MNPREVIAKLDTIERDLVLLQRSLREFRHEVYMTLDKDDLGLIR